MSTETQTNAIYDAVDAVQLDYEGDVDETNLYASASVS